MAGDAVSDHTDEMPEDETESRPSITLQGAAFGLDLTAGLPPVDEDADAHLERTHAAEVKGRRVRPIAPPREDE
jgi:hypothetical protein